MFYLRLISFGFILWIYQMADRIRHVTVPLVGFCVLFKRLIAKRNSTAFSTMPPRLFGKYDPLCPRLTSGIAAIPLFTTRRQAGWWSSARPIQLTSGNGDWLAFWYEFRRGSPPFDIRPLVTPRLRLAIIWGFLRSSWTYSSACIDPRIS